MVSMRKILILLCFSLMSGCSKQYLVAVDKNAAVGDYAHAAKRLVACANTTKGDGEKCKERYELLVKSGLPLVQAVEFYHKGVLDEKVREIRGSDRASRIDRLRASKDPWDKYLLFSELTTGSITPLNDLEIQSTAQDAFSGFAECAKQADPSCMAQYGELILMGVGELRGAESFEAKRKAFYWLRLAARYGYEQARRVLISNGEEVPTPDLAMEKLQRDANAIATNAALAHEHARRDQAAREYEMIREVRRQAEMRYWQSLFPTMVRCTSNTVGGYTYTNCW